MQKIQYTCDVCHAVKKDANHWWNGAVDNVGNRHLFVIAPWNAVGWLYDEKAIVFHLCGQECATQKLNEFMNAQPLADPPAVKKDPAGERGGIEGFEPPPLCNWPPQYHPFEKVTGNRFCGYCGAGEFHAIHQQGALLPKPDPAASTQAQEKPDHPTDCECPLCEIPIL